MSKPALTRLLSDEEVAERILPRTSALLDYLDGHLSFEEAFPEDKARDNTLLHRSIARDVYALYFQNLSHVLPPLEGIEETGFFGDFCRVISSEEYDMVRDERSEDICSENGWIYPYGFSRWSDERFSLTDTFKRAAQHAKGFIDFVKMDKETLEHYGLSPIQRAMLTYERASFLCGDIYMADAIVQNLMQVTDFSVSLRHSFEKEVSRQMTRADFENIRPELMSVLRSEALSSRIAHMRHMFGFLAGGDLFAIRTEENTGKIRLRLQDAPEGVVSNFIEEQELGDYMEAMSQKPVTGCPVFFSKDSQGNRFLDHLTGYLLDGVANDFWPLPKRAGHSQCPFHNPR